VPPRGRGRARLTEDARRLLAVQALRAFVYGLGSVLVGVSLEQAGTSSAEVGGVLAALLAGSALATVLLARYGDRVGRRRTYRLLLVLMGGAGAVFALTSWPPALVLAGLTGTVSVDVLESGPFTSLEQAMLPQAAAEGDHTRLFGAYNTVATVAGSFGALAAAASTDPQLWLLAYPVAAAIALVVAARLSPAVEAPAATLVAARPPLHRSRPIVLRLSGLFALDSFAGGFVVQAFIAYWLARKFDASTELIGVLFLAIGFLQALSFQAAVRLAGRIGLLRTMVFTHLPSNALLAAVAFAPSLGVAVALLLARSALGQMDVPARQAYVAGVVDPDERVAAAAYTNAVRTSARPLAPLVAGALLQGALGAPFLVAGALKAVYDVGLYVTFRRVAPRD